MDGAQLQFCADYSASLTQSYNGIVESAFLYPALWSTWEVQTVHTHIRDTDYYCVDEAELALQIVFQHVASSEPSPGNPNYFAQNCGVDFTLGAENSSPTPGMQWCDEPDCNLCLASQLFDRTQLYVLLLSYLIERNWRMKIFAAAMFGMELLKLATLRTQQQHLLPSLLL